MSEETKTEDFENSVEKTETLIERTNSSVKENGFEFGDGLSAPSETNIDADKNKEIVEKKTESFDVKLRKFKRQSSGIISEVRKREAYDKPSVKRKKKSEEARRHKKMGKYNRV